MRVLSAAARRAAVSGGGGSHGGDGLGPRHELLLHLLLVPPQGWVDGAAVLAVVDGGDDPARSVGGGCHGLGGDDDG